MEDHALLPKQVIVLRKDLNMRKGKMVAQGAHASLAVILDELRKVSWNEKILPPAVLGWLNGRFTKIVVSVDSEQELFDIHRKAQEAGIPCSLIQDAGFTEFKEPTYTAVGIGPEYPEKVDSITGDLKLL